MRSVIFNVARRLAIPALIALSASWAYGDVNLFGLNNITIDPYYTSPAIAPFTAPCSLYAVSCPQQTFPQGFPLTNLFGGQTQTAEGTFDTIFNDGSSGYENVFFHLNSLQPLNAGPVQLDVTGAQDTSTNPSRSFTYFDLYSYTFNPSAPLDSSDYSYTLLYSGTPVTTNGFESLTGTVNLTNAGPYFIYQFGTDTSAQYTGARVFDVAATTATPEPNFFVLLSVGMGLLFIVHRQRQASPAPALVPSHRGVKNAIALKPSVPRAS